MQPIRVIQRSQKHQQVLIDIVNYYYPPTDPFFEVKYNGKEGVSNNIKDRPVILERRSDLAIVKTANPEKEVKIGENGNLYAYCKKQWSACCNWRGCY